MTKKIVVIFIDHYYGITISVLKFIFLQMYVQSYIIFLTNLVRPQPPCNQTILSHPKMN